MSSFVSYHALARNALTNSDKVVVPKHLRRGISGARCEDRTVRTAMSCACILSFEISCMHLTRIMRVVTLTGSCCRRCSIASNVTISNATLHEKVVILPGARIGQVESIVNLKCSLLIVCLTLSVHARCLAGRPQF